MRFSHSPLMFADPAAGGCSGPSVCGNTSAVNAVGEPQAGTLPVLAGVGSSSASHWATDVPETPRHLNFLTQSFPS